MPGDGGSRRIASRFDTPVRLTLLLASVCFVVLLLTALWMPIVWDEGEYINRAAEVASWVRQIAAPGTGHPLSQLFSDAALHRYWPFVVYDEGHPSLGGVPIALSQLALTNVVHPLLAARVGPMLLFSIACGVVAFRLRTLVGAPAALFAVVALLTSPRVFAELHFATLDAQVSAWWLIAWAVDARGRADAKSASLTGVFGGLAAATKFTGVLAWIPLGVGRLLHGSRQQRVGLIAMTAAGVITFVLVNPPAWHHPIDSVAQHVRLNLHRTLNVPIMFFGHVADDTRPLPWYNTLAWWAIVTPIPLLIAGCIGLWQVTRERSYGCRTLVYHWATLMIVRAVPGTPPHDGIRLMLPSFVFWCLLAGVGSQWLWDRLSARSRLARAALVTALASGAVSVARYYPQELSYYNALVGGVRGAAALGMEPTYWWDGLDRDVLTWINTHTNPNERVGFTSVSNIGLLREWGDLKPVQAPLGGVFQWYIVQNRPSFLGEIDRRLIQTATPIFVKYPGRYRQNRPARDLSVPILYVFSYTELEAARAAVQAESGVR